MTKRLLMIGVILLSTSCAYRGPRATLPQADELAQQVMNNSGSAAWPTLARIRFTFNVEANGKLVASRSHDWNLLTHQDTVTNGDKVQTVSILAAPPPSSPEAEKNAFAAWTNDSYWLLMPLKLRDPGTKRTLHPPVTLENKSHEVVELSFESTGLTPGDRYFLYIAPPGKPQIQSFDYVPNEKKKVTFSNEAYVKSGPLTLSTEHRSADGKLHIYITQLAVETR